MADTLDAIGAEVSTNISELQTRIAQLEQQAAAKESQLAALAKTAAVDEVLRGFDFVSPAARDTGRALLDQAAACDEQGNYTAGSVPLGEYARALFRNEHSYMLSPVPCDGAGARNGIPAHRREGPLNGATLEMIRPGMSDADRAAVMGSIARALGRV